MASETTGKRLLEEQRDSLYNISRRGRKLAVLNNLLIIDPDSHST